MRFADLAGKRVLIWGAGREGLAVADHLDRLGVGFDLIDPSAGAQDEALAAAEVVVKSPGISPYAPEFADHLGPATVVTSLTDLWLAEHHDRAIGVTGTKGKSTTGTALAHLLTAAGRRTTLRGNVGRTVLDDPDPPAELVVVEVSSYQAHSVTRSPRMVVVTSLFPEHLTWHGSEARYVDDKLNLLAHEPDDVVVPGDDPRLVGLVRERIGSRARLHLTGPETVGVSDRGDLAWASGAVASDLPMLGRHQARNLALAALAAGVLGVSDEAAAHAVSSIPTLPHRLERIPSADGRTWIDDSLATAPEAVMAALDTVTDRPMTLILGGSDRGLDYTALAERLAREPDVHVLLVGAAGERFGSRHGIGRHEETFATACRRARQESPATGVVLLSPGAPSFDEFADYRERAACFAAFAEGQID